MSSYTMPIITTTTTKIKTSTNKTNNAKSTNTTPTGKNASVVIYTDTNTNTIADGYTTDTNKSIITNNISTATNEEEEQLQRQQSQQSQQQEEPEEKKYYSKIPEHELSSEVDGDTIMFTNIRDNEASRSLFGKEPAFIDFQFFLPFHPNLLTRAAAIQESIAVELEIGMNDVHIRECSQRRTERVLVKGWVTTIEKERTGIMEKFHAALHKQKLSRRLTQITKIENPRLVVSQLRLAYTSVDANNQPEIRVPELPSNRQNSASSSTSTSTFIDDHHTTPHSKIRAATLNDESDDDMLKESNARIQELQGRIDDLNEEKDAILHQSKALAKDLQTLNTKYNNEKKKWEEMDLQLKEEIRDLQIKLVNNEKTKQQFVQNAQREIDRLSYVVNSLLQMESCRQVVQLLVEESYQKSSRDSFKSNPTQK